MANDIIEGPEGRSDRNAQAKLLIEASDRGDLPRAIQIARDNATLPAETDTLSFNSSCALIDLGSSLDDSEAILLGMELARAFLSDDRIEPEYQAHARYNLSNGFGALAFQCERAKDDLGRRKNWESQRDELQKLVLEPSRLPTELRTEVLTNFGNVLDELGRSVEALDYYRQVLVIDPKHPIAAGSAGQLQLRLLGIQPVHDIRLLGSARVFLTSALSDPERVRFHSSGNAIGAYRASLQECEVKAASLFQGNLEHFEDHMRTLETTHSEFQPMQPMKSWAEYGLILTVNPNPAWCPSTLSDDLFFDGLGTTANQAGADRFNLLAHTLNQIKEDYAQARFHLHLSSHPETFTEISSATKYADTLDYADFGLASGLLKTSLRLSVDLFDKLAHFLNRYLELGIPDRNVSFASVWYEKGNMDPKKRKEHPLLAQHITSSGWLRGVQDVARNLNLYPAPSKDLRNKATHDYLVIENLSHPVVTLHGQQIRVDAHEYARQMLLMAKGSIVNTIAFVQRCEGLRAQGTKGSRAPMAFRYARGITDDLVQGER